MLSKFFRIVFLLLFLYVITGCDSSTEPDVIDDPTEFEEYELIWEDEFEQEGNELDSSNWGYDLGYGSDGWGNDEWQEYTSEPENVRVEDGKLIITAVWDSLNYASPGKRDGSVTSARVNTKDKFSVKYGKVQARIKAPVDMGMWPAFWMLGDSFSSIGWPYCGEIDIMEMSPLYHNSGTTMFTLHWWDDVAESHASYGTTRQFDYSLGDDYHIYEVEWDEQRIVGRIDGISYFIKVIDTQLMSEFLQDYFLILNVAVGGNLGGSPDASTSWNQEMLIDWVRVYQRTSEEEQISSYGIFTDETEVDAGLTVGLDAEIYVWENTLTGGTIAPYEGDNVISWSTAGVGWFGAGISSNIPVNLSTFANGYLKFMIKIPANVGFRIGINDISGTENYVDFPASMAVYGLQRTGDWEQAMIPLSDLAGGVDLSMLNYEFIILEENGTQCQFALDDIYYDGGGIIPGSINFDQSSYSLDAAGGEIHLTDQGNAGIIVSVTIDNGSETISIDIELDAEGMGVGTVNFGATDDATDTISLPSGGSITASYTDSNGMSLTASANVEGGGSADGTGIYTESHTEEMLDYVGIINSADWSGNIAVPDEESTAVSPVDGSYVLSVDYQSGSAGWGGIAFDFGSAGADATANNTFIININSSEMNGFARLGIKFEDNQGGMVEVNIASYTPVINGDWQRYEIALSDFAGVDFGDLKYLGLWNPQNSSNNLVFGMLYFDDIYLENR